MSESTGTTSKPAAAPAKASVAKSGGGTSGADRDRRGRLAFSTEEAAAELDALGVDPRLDNRTGDQRPVQPGPLKPQQFDGPEVGHFGEHADENRGEFEEATGRAPGEPLGMRSAGQLGRGDD